MKPVLASETARIHQKMQLGTQMTTGAIRFETSKSRIPVPVKNQKSSNISSKVKNSNHSIVKAKTSISNKTAKSHILQKIPQKSFTPQFHSDGVSNDKFIKNAKIKKTVQTSLRSNANVHSKLENCLLKTEEKNGTSKEKKISSLKSNLKCVNNNNNNINANNNEKALTLKAVKSTNGPFKMPISKLAIGKENKASIKSILENRIKSEVSLVEKLSTPKDVSKKRNCSSSMDNCFSAQKDIKFEANEVYRKMILSERGLSPNICNLMPGFRVSSIQSYRPSVYKMLEIPPDPLKELAQAMKNVSLSVRRDQNSVIQPKLLLSPHKDRGSFYSADPKLEVMKSLEKLRLKHSQKSAKKVTFNLNITEATTKTSCDVEQKPFKSSDSELTQISEENTPNFLESVAMTNSNEENSSKTELKENVKDFIDCQEIKTDDSDIKEHEGKYESSTFQVSLVEPFLLNHNSEKLSKVQLERSVFHNSRKADSSNLSTDFASDRVQIMENASTELQKMYKFKTSEQKSLKNENKVSQPKVYTPRPISLYSKSKLVDSASPEFLMKRTSGTLLNLAPICTPLVLKNVSKSMISPDTSLSPVRLKLDFTGKDSPKVKISKNRRFVTLENIVTSKIKLEELADQECSLYLSNEIMPVLSGRYLNDPVAVTLNEGDEMHFIPIQP